MEPTSLAQNHMTQKKLPPSQTASEVWGKIMGNNPWTRTGACHTCRWKNKRTKQSLKGRRVGNSQLICENLPMIGQKTEWTKLHTGWWYDFVIRQPGDTGNTNLVLCIILGYNVIIPAYNTWSLDWGGQIDIQFIGRITFKSVLGFCPGILAS